jgi:hypothetical protein
LSGGAQISGNAYRHSGTGGPGATSLVLVGAFARVGMVERVAGFMAQVAGNESTVDWTLTFLRVLLP